MFVILHFTVLSNVAKCLPPPKTFADPQEINKAIDAILNAKQPLVIIGKGWISRYLT